MNSISETPSTGECATGGQGIPRLIVLVSVCLMIAVVLTERPLQSANDRSRWATVWSLVHRGTWQIDEIDRDPEWSTIDKVRHRASDEEPYHFYSSKPPLLSTVAAGLYWIERRALDADLRRDTLSVTRSVLIVLNVLPMALALWLFANTLRQLNVSVHAQCYVLLLAGVGSMLNPYLATLNNHTPAAVCLLICLTTLIRIQQQEPQQTRACDFVVVGLTAALTSCFELPAALFGIVSFVWMVSLNARRTLLWYVPAALIPLAAFFVTNWLVTGGVWPFYAYYGTDKYIYIHNGVPSYWSNPQGIDANTEGTLTYLLHCTIGHHGLLTHTPAFLLSLWGWIRMRQAADRRSLRWVLPAGAVLSLAVLGFYLSRTENYNYGGNTVALRWMLWLSPFWWFALIDPAQRLLRANRGRILCGVLLAASVVTTTVSVSNPWRPSWIYAAMSQAGWFDYRTSVTSFDPPRHAVIASWPAESGVTASWVSGHSGDLQRIHVRSQGERRIGSDRIAEVRLTRSLLTQGETVSDSAAIVVLLDAFEAGKPVDDWLFVRTDANEPPAGRQQLRKPPAWLVRLVRGLPADRPYAGSGVRWYQLTPDSMGHRCARAASRVPVDDRRYGRCWHRSDVWYCDDVPFGVLRWTTQVTQESSGEVVQVVTWTAENIQ